MTKRAANGEVKLGRIARWIDPRPREDVIARHTLADRITHWANAALWMLLFLTGLALFEGEHAPIGQWYPDLIRFLVGGGGNLLVIHLALGVIWILVLLFYIVTNLKEIRVFLHYVLNVFPGDLAWIMRKPFHLALGKRISSWLGVPKEIPPQSFYNIGQRSYAVCAMLCCFILAVSGLLMLGGMFGLVSTTIIGWCVLVHFVCACGLFAFLIVHFWMAALVKEERPGLFSMFSGTLPVDFAKHHHGLWYQDMMEKSEKET